MATTERLPCQVCGRKLAVRSDGLARPHRVHQGISSSPCQGVGYRLARWPVGQQLRHHGGSVWEVVEDREAESRWGDYLIRCVIGTKKAGWLGGEEAGKEMTAHGEYLHRDGWLAVGGEGNDGTA